MMAMIAARNLAGVGNPMREWINVSDNAYHLRRRLKLAEQAITGNAVDLRNTVEALDRLEALRSELPDELLAFASAEITGRI